METWKNCIIFSIIFTVIFLFIIIVLVFYNKSKKNIIISSIFFSITSIFLIISILFYNIEKNNYKNSYQCETIYYLASFEDGQALEGNFWLYYGSISEQNIYKFYIITDNGYQLKTTYASDDTYVREIKENQNIKPCYMKEKIAGSLDWIYVFYIPKGSLFD